MRPARSRTRRTRFSWLRRLQNRIPSLSWAAAGRDARARTLRICARAAWLSSRPCCHATRPRVPPAAPCGPCPRPSVQVRPAARPHPPSPSAFGRRCALHCTTNRWARGNRSSRTFPSSCRAPQAPASGGRFLSLGAPVWFTDDVWSTSPSLRRSFSISREHYPLGEAGLEPGHLFLQVPVLCSYLYQLPAQERYLRRSHEDS